MFPTTCVTFSHTSLPADPKMCFRLISRECSAWFRAACAEPIKAPLQGVCWDTHTCTHTDTGLAQLGALGAGPARSTGAQLLLPASQDLAIKACLLQSPLRAIVFWLLNCSSQRGIHPPRTACVGTEERPCSGINPPGASRWGQFQVLFLCARTSVLGCSFLCYQHTHVAEVNSSCSALPFYTWKFEN